MYIHAKITFKWFSGFRELGIVTVKTYIHKLFWWFDKKLNVLSI